MRAELSFIGEISSPYQSVSDCPNNIQSNGPLCEITLYSEFQDGLSGLESGQNIMVMYWLDGADRGKIMQACRNGNAVRGTFSLRSHPLPTVRWSADGDKPLGL